jgi:hypothetical protein
LPGIAGHHPNGLSWRPAEYARRTPQCHQVWHIGNACFSVNSASACRLKGSER